MSEMHPSMARLYSATKKLSEPVTTQSALAEGLGQSPQVVNNWETRGISLQGALAAQRAWGISAVWILYEEGPEAVGGASQSEQLDPETIRAAHQLVSGIYQDEDNVYSIEEEPDVFAKAYQKLRKFKGRPSMANVVSITTAMVRERQEGGDRGQGERNGRVGGAVEGAGKKR